MGKGLAEVTIPQVVASTSAFPNERTGLLNDGSMNQKRAKKADIKSLEALHCLYFIIVVVIIFASLIGLFFLVKITYQGGSGANCHFIHVNKQSRHSVPTTINNNHFPPTRASKTLSTIIKSATPDRYFQSWFWGSDLRKPAKQLDRIDSPYSQMFRLVSDDNLVKLDFQGYVLAEEIAKKYEFVSNMGTSAVLTHHLTDNIPTIKISFSCGQITIYLNENLDSHSNTHFDAIMLTGETTSGVIFEQREYFDWRTPILKQPFFPNDPGKSHYFCDEKRKIPLIIHGDSKLRFTLVLEFTELEIFRQQNPEDKDKFTTIRGKRCNRGTGTANGTKT